MDAPKGRYRVEEKDGRLVVTDTLTGAPISQPPPRAPGARSAGPVSPRPPGLSDRLGRLLLRLVVSRWDDAGRAVIAWEWQQNGRTARWDAILDTAQQRRLGRALSAILAFPLLVLLLILGIWILFPLAFVAFGVSAWGVMAVLRLQRETGGIRGPEG
jgi:hypothetical protein